MVRWRCCSKVERYDEIERRAAQKGNVTPDEQSPVQDQQHDSKAVESKDSEQSNEPFNPDDLNAVRSWRERHLSAEDPVNSASGVSDGSLENEEAPNAVRRIVGEPYKVKHESAVLQQQEQEQQRQLRHQHLLELHQREQQLQLQHNKESSGNEVPVSEASRAGGFPTFTAEEEKWRRNQLLNKEVYLSSSSSSSVEDQILHHRFHPLGDLASTGPADVDDLENDEICSSSISRPGTDAGEIQPLGPRKLSHVQVSDVQFPTSTNPSLIDDNQSQYLEIDCRPADSDELDAIVAAINEHTDQQDLTENVADLNSTERAVGLGSSLHAVDDTDSVASIQGQAPATSPDIDVVNPLSPNIRVPKVQRIAPSRRDSPSVHDPKAYGGVKTESPALITPYASYDSNESIGTGSKSSAASLSSPKVTADQRRRERSRSRGHKRNMKPSPSHRQNDRESSTSSKVRESLDISRNQSPPTSGEQIDDNDDSDNNDRLSDVPSDVDVAVRERYLKACRILKSTLIEKDASIDPSEKVFLASLLLDDAPSTSLPSTQAQLEAVDLATQSSRSNPLFDTTTSIVSSSSSDYRKGDIYSELTFSPVPISERTMAMHDDKVRKSERTMGSEIVSTRKPTLSHTSSSLFSRMDDDYPFKILGSEGFKPTVLTPTVMEALRGFFPYAVSEENYLLKYALERDGAALMSLLSKVRGCTHTIISVETVGGFVFGAFCSSPWRIQPSWFGSGESFLWRLKNPRISNDSQTYNNDGDNEIEIYPYTGADEMIQFCTPQTIAVGGGTDWGSTEHGSPYEGEPSGIGFLVDGDIGGGETSSCVTFANPRLGDRTSNTQEFEIQALEVWTVTPCLTLSDAEDLEMGKLLREELSV